ncbi:putative quinol monooxygenase [Sulfobacillus harzensis]|uniref:Antibiotic biosynthesis monooxygenase n=1 Tax=Sulfobacillus harzensis TaxID=2729629 RepID=A0A7Y0L7P2_9FIRM|nr:antibiotic biosynthesis monooxygenase [Sulfobacillus harzensis]NMP24837.1 antibiotic biosynthesis monooxygenase [Sulfobacillus harzensis]
MSEFGLYTKFTAHDGQRDVLVQILLEAADSMALVDGCDLYVVNIPDDEPNGVWVTEIWRDSVAHDASLSLDTAMALIQRARPLIARVNQIKLRPVGGKGI